MNKNIFFVLTLFCFFNCSSTTHKNETIEENLTKEQLLQKLYKNIVKPLFTNYNNTDIPNDFTVDTKDNTINAGASHNFLEVSQGLINSEKEYIQIFVLAHEISHIVTLNQAKLVGLEGAIPSGTNTNDYKKSEYLADLIAIHLINTKLPEQMNLLNNEFDFLKSILGNEDYMHPSGTQRIKMMKTYIAESSKNTSSIALKKLFKQIWNMS